MIFLSFWIMKKLVIWFDYISLMFLQWILFIFLCLIFLIFLHLLSVFLPFIIWCYLYLIIFLCNSLLGLFTLDIFLPLSLFNSWSASYLFFCLISLYYFNISYYLIFPHLPNIYIFCLPSVFILSIDYRFQICLVFLYLVL